MGQGVPAMIFFVAFTMDLILIVSMGTMHVFVLTCIYVKIVETSMMMGTLAIFWM